eukprot:11857024-Alexandrium_andersonii.AAC.1
MPTLASKDSASLRPTNCFVAQIECLGGTDPAAREADALKGRPHKVTRDRLESSLEVESDRRRPLVQEG